jgi:putative membrane protein
MSPGAPQSDETQLGDPRTYFAAERTLLAWVRTGLAMMGFGFVVARFGLFLRELAAVDHTRQHAFAGSLWIGTTLVLLGVVVNLAAAVQHWQTVSRLASDRPVRLRRMSLATITAIILGLLGILIGIYLVFEFREPTTAPLPKPFYNK